MSTTKTQETVTVNSVIQEMTINFEEAMKISGFSEVQIKICKILFENKYSWITFGSSDEVEVSDISLSDLQETSRILTFVPKYVKYIASLRTEETSEDKFLKFVGFYYDEILLYLKQGFYQKPPTGLKHLSQLPEEFQ